MADEKKIVAVLGATGQQVRNIEAFSILLFTVVTDCSSSGRVGCSSSFVASRKIQCSRSDPQSWFFQCSESCPHWGRSSQSRFRWPWKLRDCLRGCSLSLCHDWLLADHVSWNRGSPRKSFDRFYRYYAPSGALDLGITARCTSYLRGKIFECLSLAK